MAVNILLYLLILLRLLIGIRLIAVGKRNNLPNLYWLAGAFLVTVLGLLFAPTVGNPLGDLPFSLWLFIIGGAVGGQALLIVFNQTTFYQNKKSPVAWFWLIFAVTSVITIYGISISESNYSQSPWVAAYIVPTQFLVWGWHGWAASQARKNVMADSAVEDWVKSRYQLITVYSILIIIGVAGSLVRIVVAGGSAQSALGNLMGIITLLMQISSVTLQFLVWVMPEGFRRWLNRDQKKHSEDRIHEQAQAVLNILGTAMSDGTGVSKMLALFTIRKVIGMQINSEETAQVEARAVNMGFDEWMETLNHPELYMGIKNAGANINPYDVLDRVKQTLIEKQSLFTLKAK